MSTGSREMTGQEPAESSGPGNSTPSQAGGCVRPAGRPTDAAAPVAPVKPNRPLFERRWLLWAAFIAVHAWLGWLGCGPLRTQALNDVEIYRQWLTSPLGLPVFNYAWVYPAGALIPISIAGIGTSSSTIAYVIAWCVLITALDALALISLRRWRPVGSWWWLVFLLALGPIAIGRLDAVIAPIMVIGLAWARRHVAAASALLTLGAWIKIAPVAGVVALAATTKGWIRRVAAPALAVTAAIVAVVAAGGGIAHIASFLTEQGQRGLQVESVLGTPLVLVRALTGQPVASYNGGLNTFEVPGELSVEIATWADPLLVTVLIVIGVLIWRARWRGYRTVVLGTFTLLVAMIVFNKVGSPQFICWLAPAVVVALSDGHRRRTWIPIALTTLFIALGTQLLFPVFYQGFLSGWLPIVLVEAVRNLLVLAVGVWAFVQLARSAIDAPWPPWPSERRAAEASLSAGTLDVGAPAHVVLPQAPPSTHPTTARSADQFEPSHTADDAAQQQDLDQRGRLHAGDHGEGRGHGCADADPGGVSGSDRDGPQRIGQSDQAQAGGDSEDD